MARRLRRGVLELFRRQNVTWRLWLAKLRVLVVVVAYLSFSVYGSWEDAVCRKDGVFTRL